MYIFLAIIVELVTIIRSVVITNKAEFDFVLKVAENGYRIDEAWFRESRKRKIENKNTKLFTKLTKIVEKLDIIVLCIPGINLLNSHIKSIILKKSVMNMNSTIMKEIKESLILMTDKDKREYAELKGNIEKVMFTVLSEKEHFNGLHCGVALLDEELMPLAYTLDEVKKLNEITTYSYRIGTIDGKNVAIIGILNLYCPIDGVEFTSERFKIKHTFTEMTEEEAKDKTFTVYFLARDRDKNEELQKAVTEIKNSRIKDIKESNLEFQQTKSLFDPVYIPIGTEEFKVEEQQRRVLKKKKNKKKK